MIKFFISWEIVTSYSHKEWKDLFVLHSSGEKLVQALENGVSQYPKLEGRFPQVAGVQFVFDPKAEPGSRIIRDLVKVGDEYLVPDMKYRLVTKAYMHQGRDGYNMLIDCPILVKQTFILCIQNIDQFWSWE